MQGHFQIGDLNFSVNGDLKELAHCQEIVREIKGAERDLKRISGSKYVNLIYDKDLEGDQGTFDKTRLRTYGNGKSYDIDIGQTDKNPLGIFVRHDADVRVYDYESEESWHLDRDGNRLDDGQSSSNGAAPDQSSRQQRQPQQSSPDELRVTDADRRLTATAKKAINQGNGDQPIGEEEATVIWQTMKRSGLKKQDYSTVCDVFDVDTLAELPYGSVRGVYDRVKDMVEFENTELPY